MSAWNVNKIEFWGIFCSMWLWLFCHWAHHSMHSIETWWSGEYVWNGAFFPSTSFYENIPKSSKMHPKTNCRPEIRNKKNSECHLGQKNEMIFYTYLIKLIKSIDYVVLYLKKTYAPFMTSLFHQTLMFGPKLEFID